MTFEVRPENRDDYAAIRALVAAAFRDAEMSAPSVEADGVPGEATLVTWLREGDAYVPEFALVAVRNGELVGHVMATRGDVDGRPLLGVGPLSVHPLWQRRGVGSMLMKHLVDAATTAGEPGLVLLGDPAYYGRFGFAPASRWRIEADPQWGNYFQAVSLAGRALPSGHFSYPDAFARLG